MYHIESKNINLNTNLAGNCYEDLINGRWNIGFIDDNKGLEDPNNDEFYEKKNDKEGKNFKNKVNVVLADGSKVYQHIIHWHESDGYFCTTSNSFWDQFETEN